MQTQIRFLHAYPPEKAFILSENGAVDILLNDQMIVERLLFGEHTDYISVEPGRGTISVFPSGNREQTLVRNNVIIPEDNRYTLILADRDGAPVLAPVQEREITLADGYSGIRFGHLAVGTEPVRIILVDRYEQSEPVY